MLKDIKVSIFAPALGHPKRAPPPRRRSAGARPAARGRTAGWAARARGPPCRRCPSWASARLRAAVPAAARASGGARPGGGCKQL